jgi:hypothetical protein
MFSFTSIIFLSASVVENGEKLKMPSGLVDACKALRTFDGLDEFIFQLQIAFVGRQIESVEAVMRKKMRGNLINFSLEG